MNNIKTTKLGTALTFDRFVKGECNELAIGAAKEVVSRPGVDLNPLFIYGDVGVGKTHLMSAIGNDLLKIHSPDNNPILYVHSESFISEIVRALEANQIENFRNKYCNSRCLLIDDIQFLAGKKRTQEEFSHVFQALMSRSTQIVMACDRYPKTLKNVEPRLESRFGAGVSVLIEPPDYTTRVSCIIQLCRERKTEIPVPVAIYIAEKIKSNFREIEGAIGKIIFYAKLSGEKISIDLVNRALSDLFALQGRRLSVENIVVEVALYFNIRPESIYGKSRVRAIARPRQVTAYLAKELLNISIREIGKQLGGRSHVSVLKAHKLITNEIKEGQEIYSDVVAIRRILES